MCFDLSINRTASIVYYASLTEREERQRHRPVFRTPWLVDRVRVHAERSQLGEARRPPHLENGAQQLRPLCSRVGGAQPATETPITDRALERPI